MSSLRGWCSPGGVLSPPPFNLTLRRLRQHLPAGVRVAMHADDLLLYVTEGSIQKASELLRLACERLTPWLASLALGISIPKLQLCVSSRGRLGNQDISITINQTVIQCHPTVNYLGIILDERMTWFPHIRAVATKASRAVNILRDIARIS